MPSWKRRLGWTVVLFLTWILFAQSFHWQSLITGIVVAFFVTMWNDDLLLSLSNDLHVERRTMVQWFMFAVWLVIDICKAAWQVAVVACAFRMDIQPQYVTHPIKVHEPAMRMVLANSITLTPGTLTVEAPQKGEFVVHALTDAAAEGLKDWHIENRLVAIERRLPR
ncbi:MAG: Na+/H+ antiporter subunit E [Firmicutes bacterium]|nr:Na+/H+ antiporter subunit E [Dethiobacter sp.]MBS3889035.1 Na+/H+ antiporter subunit E [Bacillota bacterium]MBS4053751.1 Na+/H+ antiporter subunit E [Thermaerobacter sp.]